jgi:lipoyl(octanoyl) transferase
VCLGSKRAQGAERTVRRGGYRLAEPAVRLARLLRGSGGAVIAAVVGELRWCFLGRVDYDAARDMQNAWAAARASDSIGDHLLLLEHPAVLTVGRNAPMPVLARGDGRRVVRTDRGGDVTYHGPGQLVGYPVVRLPARGRGVRRFVRAMEQALCDVALAAGVAAVPRRGLPGVWAGSSGTAGKLGSIGLGVRRGVTLHGFSLNVDRRAEQGFRGIAPCGLEGVETTSLESMGAMGVPDLERIASIVARAMAVRTDANWIPRPLTAAEMRIREERIRGKLDGTGRGKHGRALQVG